MTGSFAFMGQWLKVALIVFGVCAGWMVVGYLIFDADDDDVVQTTMAHKSYRTNVPQTPQRP